jgi:hypothetical protein
MSITYLYGEGGFLSKKKKIIYCITNPFIYSKLKRVILSVDPNAIMEATYVCETSGLDSSLITPIASTHKEYCSQQIYITYIFWARERMLTLAF